MVFSSNPLSLSVPDPTFDAWLRDSGYLEILDQHSSSTTTVAPTNTSIITSTTTTATTAGLFISFFSHILTLLSLFTLNPFSKLTTDDFSGQTPSWTRSFFADSGSYSFPSGSDQARLRVNENVKRYARNYASLFILSFACTLYQMPLALIGLISSLALWDVFKFCNDRWGWDRYPVLWQVMVRTAQCVTAVVLICLNVQMALFGAIGISYTGAISNIVVSKSLFIILQSHLSCEVCSGGGLWCSGGYMVDGMGVLPLIFCVCEGELIDLRQDLGNVLERGSVSSRSFSSLILISVFKSDIKLFLASGLDRLVTQAMKTSQAELKLHNPFFPFDSSTPDFAFNGPHLYPATLLVSTSQADVIPSLAKTKAYVVAIPPGR
ncbi:hypothetical protein SADUNF_Sadunf16G0260800 [Salix dunnii]|uniref:PRA1 family protein n=1 Tax=Salix dunnii TaxID=1413687 RepID=A0A835JC94_9ROSI|nr:hypothetical protein SADUNF_Sadunf16G0260800 [Salix dunnii]